MKLIQVLTRTTCFCLLGFSAMANAVNLEVTHWSDGMYGAPYAVALAKGFFKDAGVNITGFLSSKGGGTSVRNTMASEIPYGEVALSAAIAAAQHGVKLTIVNGGVISLADLMWVARKGSDIHSFADMKGKKMGYSSPKSVTDMVSTICLTKAGVFNDVDRIATGGIASGLTALHAKGVDAAIITEPVLSEKKDTIQIAFRSTDCIPHMTQTVGIVQTDYLKKHPDVIKAIIAARRKGVDYIKAHPDESAKIFASQQKLDPAVARSALNTIISSKGDYWSSGRLDYTGMDVMLHGLRLVKAIDTTPFDWSKIVDESYLPADQRSK